MIILIDFDDVLTETSKGIIALCEQKFKRKDCINEWDLTKMFHCTEEDIGNLFATKDFFFNLKPKEGSIEAILKLIKKHKVYIVTAVSYHSADELDQKRRWLEKHIPQFNINNLIACRKKWMIKGDIIIDDNPNNFREEHMKCILMDAPHNKEVIGYDRIKDLREIVGKEDECAKI
jgi:5'(3')-deoxyribonucleotidase